jgi:hypothetical protein
MAYTDSALRRALTSGTIAGAGTALAASLAGRRETGSYAAPLNATSHIVWGDAAATRNDVSFKYTLTGFLLNHGAAIFWASFYEKWFGARSASGLSGSMLRPAIGAAVVTAGAYITDYYLVPKRFTPGYEKRLSGRSLATIYGVLALSYIATDLLRAKAAPALSSRAIHRV